MIMEYDHTYDRAKLLGDKEIYSFDLLLRLFEKFEMLPHLFTMIIFDILIGNTDRHQDNFGIIRNESTMEIRFAPLYDNASCLGREMTQERIGKILKDTQMFHAYLHGKKSHSLIRWGNLNINERPNMFDLFRKIISVTPQIKHYISILDKLSDDVIDGIVYKIPKVMSDNQKLFVSRVLKTRRDILLEEK
ncbi:Serine/threonine-protein kinase CtkA [compost metagenome]